MAPLVARYRHRLSLKSPDHGTQYLGDVTTHSDSAQYKVSPELVIQTVKLASFPTFESRNCTSFYLTTNRERNPKIIDLLKFLRSNPHHVGFMYFDSAGSTALLFPIRPEESSEVNGSDGFRCYVLALKQKTSGTGSTGSNELKAPNAVVPTDLSSSSSREGIQSSTGVEQELAAKHYNELKRESATRHLSHIYHLRKLNNIIKSKIIETAAKKARVRILNSTNVVPKGLRVIDFGCGMGGDIFKWGLNPAGGAKTVVTSYLQEFHDV